MKTEDAGRSRGAMIDAEPLRIADGLAIAPDRPGHGIEFDWKELDGLRAT